MVTTSWRNSPTWRRARRPRSSKRLWVAGTFLQAAHKHELIDENPCSDGTIPPGQRERLATVRRPRAVGRLLAVAGLTWRVIIALARYGGLRCPSEVLSREWRHVDRERGRITVPSLKTDRYDGKGSRTIPLF